MNKSGLRRQALSARDHLWEQERIGEELSQRIAKRLLSQDYYKEAQIVFSYASFRSEVSTDFLNQKVLEDGKILCLPKTFIKEKKLRFYRVSDLQSLVSGYQGIREPMDSEEQSFSLSASESAGGRVLMLMPGVAYDADKNRLGYGGGYYDRFLTLFGEKIEYKVMLAFSCQEVREIESEPTDKKPDRIVTERAEF